MSRLRSAPWSSTAVRPCACWCRATSGRRDGRARPAVWSARDAGDTHVTQKGPALGRERTTRGGRRPPAAARGTPRRPARAASGRPAGTWPGRRSARAGPARRARWRCRTGAAPWSASPPRSARPRLRLGSGLGPYTTILLPYPTLCLLHTHVPLRVGPRRAAQVHSTEGTRCAGVRLVIGKHAAVRQVHVSNSLTFTGQQMRHASRHQDARRPQPCAARCRRPSQARVGLKPPHK
jgi:hypothetical protein